MKNPRWRDKFLLDEDLNFLLTNRIPRLALTRLMGRLSRIRSRWLTRLSIAIWRHFTELDLSDAREQRFDSLQACFTRALRPRARPFDTRQEVIASPCDAIVGACGLVEGDEVLQIKGMPYPVQQLLGSDALATRCVGGNYITLRLTSAMYHRFHAPHALMVDRVTHIAGDTWNVNPIALRRVQRLFCRNVRVVIEARFSTLGDRPVLLVPVGAILVASVRLHFLDLLLPSHHRGPRVFDCDSPLAKGEEMGWFEHGSTIVMFTPPGCTLASGVTTGSKIRAGQPLLWA